MWSGSSASSADEWIELYNRGLEPVDLSGWTITRGDAEDEQVMILIPVAVIMPGEVFLIANYKADDDRSRLAWIPDLVDAAVSLPKCPARRGERHAGEGCLVGAASRRPVADGDP
jgi:hypothetical protein